PHLVSPRTPPPLSPLFPYTTLFRSGTAKTKYYISSAYQDENGIIKPASYDRFSLRTNLNTEVSSWLKLNTNLNFSRNTRMDATEDRKSTRLNSSHVSSSYAVFCLNK